MAKVDGKDAKTKVKLDWGRYWIDLGFHALETALQDSSGKYCVGDRVTCADLFLVPQVYNANRFGVDMTKFPTIARIEKSLSELPAFESTSKRAARCAMNTLSIILHTLLVTKSSYVLLYQQILLLLL